MKFFKSFGILLLASTTVVTATNEDNNGASAGDILGYTAAGLGGLALTGIAAYALHKPIKNVMPSSKTPAKPSSDAHSPTTSGLKDTKPSSPLFPSTPYDSAIAILERRLARMPIETHGGRPDRIRTITELDQLKMERFAFLDKKRPISSASSQAS